MADYTKANLKQVEDQAPKFGLSPDLEARFARVALECERVGVTYQRLGPNFRIPFGHNHKTQEEVYVLIAGSGRVKVGDDVVELEPWDALRVSKEAMRGFEAGPGGAEFVVIGAPGGPGDAVTTPDWWSD
jgi:mannose-6-phosphate isomerase-like protein (cupin superfamily)